VIKLLPDMLQSGFIPTENPRHSGRLDGEDVDILV
jgi:hypothetical protein